MKSKVTIFNTIHEDTGEKCNSYILGNILSAFNPDVIFIEYPADEEIHDWNSLEHRAVVQFLSRTYDKRPPIVPVDATRPTDEWWTFIEKYLFDPLHNYCSEYISWHYIDTCRIKQYGFSYLNSEESEIAHQQEQQILKRFAYSTGEASIIKAYKDYYDVIEKRDNAFLQHITEYCAALTVQNGLFLVGAGHRKSLREKTAQQENEYVEWEFVRS